MIIRGAAVSPERFVSAFVFLPEPSPEANEKPAEEEIVPFPPVFVLVLFGDHLF